MEQDNKEQDTKNCPFCAERILRQAIKCKHCGEFVNSAEARIVSAPDDVLAKAKVHHTRMRTTRIQALGAAIILLLGTLITHKFPTLNWLAEQCAYVGIPFIFGGAICLVSYDYFKLQQLVKEYGKDIVPPNYDYSPSVVTIFKVIYFSGTGLMVLSPVFAMLSGDPYVFLFCIVGGFILRKIARAIVWAKADSVAVSR